jgi:hypothetical protein
VGIALSRPPTVDVRRNFATEKSRFGFVSVGFWIRVRHGSALMLSISGIASHHGDRCNVSDAGELVPSCLLTFKSYFAPRSKVPRSALLNALL